jgi:hypothetical protein
MHPREVTISEAERPKARTRLNWWVVALCACVLNVAYEVGTSALIVANAERDIDPDTGFGLGFLITAVVAVVLFIRGRRDLAAGLVAGGAAAFLIFTVYVLVAVIPHTY